MSVVGTRTFSNKFIQNIAPLSFPVEPNVICVCITHLVEFGFSGVPPLTIAKSTSTPFNIRSPTPVLPAPKIVKCRMASFAFVVFPEYDSPAKNIC